MKRRRGFIGKRELEDREKGIHRSMGVEAHKFPFLALNFGGYAERHTMVLTVQVRSR